MCVVRFAFHFTMNSCSPSTDSLSSTATTRQTDSECEWRVLFAWLHYYVTGREIHAHQFTSLFECVFYRCVCQCIRACVVGNRRKSIFKLLYSPPLFLSVINWIHSKRMHTNQWRCDRSCVHVYLCIYLHIIQQREYMSPFLASARTSQHIYFQIFRRCVKISTYSRNDALAARRKWQPLRKSEQKLMCSIFEDKWWFSCSCCCFRSVPWFIRRIQQLCKCSIVVFFLLGRRCFRTVQSTG